MGRNSTEYVKMYHFFWSGKTGKALRGDSEAQTIQHYLINNQHANMWGIYYLPKTYIIHDTGQKEKVVNRVLKTLAEVGFAYYDDETEYVFVVEMAHMQVGEMKDGDKRMTWPTKEYKAMPNNPFLGMFYDRYVTELQLNTPRRGHGYPINVSPIQDPFASSEGAYKPLDIDIDIDVDVVSLSSLEDKNTEKDKETTTESIGSKIVPQRRFSDKPENLMDLWNEMVTWHTRKYKLNDSLKKLIREAYKYAPERDDWVGIFNEYSQSAYLRGELPT